MKWGLALVASLVILILLLAVALYLPPVQNWAVHKASEYASEAMDMEITVERVRLAFPLDLGIEGVRALRQNDSLPQRKDTVAEVRRAVVDVRLLPLMKSEVVIDEIELNGAKINTIDFVPQARVKGTVGRLALTGGHPVATIDLSSSDIALTNILLDGARLDVALADSVPEDATQSENLWKIKLGELKITNSAVRVSLPGDSMRVGVAFGELTAKNGWMNLHKGLYEIASLVLENGAVEYDTNAPLLSAEGVMDYDHVALRDVSARIDSLRFASPDIALKVRSLAMTERSGLTVRSLVADVSMDSTHLDFDGTLRMPSSFITAKLSAALDAFDNTVAPNAKDWFNAGVDASVDVRDILPLVGEVPQSARHPLFAHPVIIKGAASGDIHNIDIPHLSMEMPTAFALDAKGRVEGVMNYIANPDTTAFKASLRATLDTYNLSFVKAFLDKGTAGMINIPQTHITADADVDGTDYTLALKAREGRGTMAANARMNTVSGVYKIDARTNRLNLGHYIRGMRLGTLTCSLNAEGRGTDVFSKRTRMKGGMDIRSLAFAGYGLDNITAGISLENGRGHGVVRSGNDLMDGTVGLDLLLDPKRLDATLMTELRKIDLQKLSLVEVPLAISVCSHIDVASDYSKSHKIQGVLTDIGITDSVRTYRPDDIVVDAQTNRDTTFAKVDCGDFAMRLNASGGHEEIIRRAETLTAIIKRQLEERTIDQIALREELPTMRLSLHSSKENPIARIIKYYGVDFNDIDISLNTSRESGVFADMRLLGLATGGYQLDTIAFHVNSTSNPHTVTYTGKVHNVKPNDYVFNAMIDGKLLEHGIIIGARFFDADNVQGLRIGTEATMVEEGIRFRLVPSRPVIAYENFNVNADNYLLLGKGNRISADIDLLADNGTGIQLYSINDVDTATMHGGDNAEAAEIAYANLQDLTLSLSNLNLGKLLAAIPYAPKADGTLFGDVHFVQEHDQSFSISSSIQTRQLSYEGSHIGNLGTELVYMPKADGSHYVDGIISLDDNEIGNITGSYNFDTSVIDAEMGLTRFPLMIANGFVPDKIIGLEGFAEGTLSIKGTSAKPDVNGELYLESSSLISKPYSIRMRFDDDPIRIVNSKLLFENFQMYANNNQPLVSRGELDFSNLDHMSISLLMKAENFLLIDSKENRSSEAYGKAYVNFLASIRGQFNRLQVRGRVDVLPSTNLFYILRDSPLTADNRMKELVTFTDFTSTKPLEVQRPTVDGMTIDLNINIMNGAHVKCWLNDARTNYLDILGDGTMRMRYANDDMRMTGRYTISEGELKYSLPIIPLKTFVISNGSYIEFTGDMMNPRLSITAKEHNKASVNVDGTNRMVEFQTGVVLSKTLNDMGLQFVIDAPEDKTISDELSMMSMEERGKIAVTMLTTGMYLADGNTSSFSMNSALNSFLQSEISSIAGSALKTLDLSFGMDNSTGEDGTMHTDYSFKFAKRFWNNRLSVSVGGKISTGSEAAGRDNSFFDNVAVQYRLSDVSNKYMHLFYNRSVYDFLEGYVGQYGAGFMWKKKMQSLKEIFRPSSANTQRPQPLRHDTIRSPSVGTLQGDSIHRVDSIK